MKIEFYNFLKSNTKDKSLTEDNILEYFARKYSKIISQFLPIYNLLIHKPIQVTDESILKKYSEMFIACVIEECIIHRLDDIHSEYIFGRFFDVVVNCIDDIRSKLYFEIFYSIPIKKGEPLRANIVIHLIDLFLKTEEHDQPIDKTLSILIQIDRLIIKHVNSTEVSFGNLISEPRHSELFYDYLKQNELIDNSQNFIFFKDRVGDAVSNNSKLNLAYAIASFYIHNYFRPDITDRKARDLFARASSKDFGVMISSSTFRDAINFLKNNKEAIDKRIPIGFQYNYTPKGVIKI